MKKKFIMSYSCGKDSTLALYKMVNQGHIPSGLLVTVDESLNRSWFHGIPEPMLEKVSESMNIPLMLVKCKGNQYEATFENALKKAKEQGVTACVFGDIDIEQHRQWCSERCEKVGIEAIFPLWQGNREEITYEFIETGFKAVLKNVKLEYLDEGYLGKVLTKDLVGKIKSTGADPCGENGEYHTFVFDGPLFKFPIEFTTNGNITNNGYGYLDIR
ncbi:MULTISPECIES: diphthine--ammonia ligase [Clostridium]|uniref:Diphthine--ammonia ligase n=1 Tax=Clostridium senegalense TaxID=1465809 RepID=A0A6M0H715_9CLOT|nr:MULTISPECIES: diphthine--ammonia ligase [Clostridium]NEU05793.1 diphthine--ammonia ligase [Clostridium senegalense]